MNTEIELIERAQAGDAAAFSMLARQYERRIHSLARYYCRNEHDAEDLSQEVWLKAYRAIRSFRRDASFYTWLRQIMINTFLNHQRGTPANARPVAFAPEGDGGEFAEPGRDSENELHQKLLVGRIRSVIDDLSPQQKLIFLLKHQDGMTCDEIARSLACSTGTVKKTLFRTVLKVRELLGVQLARTSVE